MISRPNPDALKPLQVGGELRRRVVPRLRFDCSRQWTEEGQNGLKKARKEKDRVRDGSPMNVPCDGARRRSIFPRGQVVPFEQMD